MLLKHKIYFIFIIVSGPILYLNFGLQIITQPVMNNENLLKVHPQRQVFLNRVMNDSKFNNQE